MSYKDTTFCTYYKDCRDREGCLRPLTPTVQASADHWWGKDGAPIAVFASHPHCFRVIE